MAPWSGSRDQPELDFLENELRSVEGSRGVGPPGGVAADVDMAGRAVAGHRNEFGVGSLGWGAQGRGRYQQYQRHNQCKTQYFCAFSLLPYLPGQRCCPLPNRNHSSGWSALRIVPSASDFVFAEAGGRHPGGDIPVVLEEEGEKGVDHGQGTSVPAAAPLNRDCRRCTLLDMTNGDRRLAGSPFQTGESLE